MADFVNYKKRAITLPPGCKNLIDLLQPQRKGRPSSILSLGGQPAVTRGQSGTSKLSEIEKYVALPFESQAKMFILTLSFPDERLTVDFTHVEGELMSASAVFEEDVDRERLVREFFVSHDLQVPGDGGRPAQFVANVPAQLIYRILPMPSNSPMASKLVRELFRHACGLNDDAVLTFSHYEIANAA